MGLLYFETLTWAQQVVVTQNSGGRWTSSPVFPRWTRLCLVAQLCPTFCDPMDYSPPSSSVHVILQARILEWVAMPSSRGTVPTKGLKLHLQSLLHCRQILYPLSYRGSPMLRCLVSPREGAESPGMDRCCQKSYSNPSRPLLFKGSTSPPCVLHL